MSEYPKPWRVGFNGTIATVIASNGRAVSWEDVEAAMNRPSLEGDALLREVLNAGDDDGVWVNNWQSIRRRIRNYLTPQS